MTQLIIQGTTLEDFLYQVKKTVSETIKAEKSESPKQVKPNYLTRSEVAGRFNISLPTLNEYTKKGLIPAYRFGARVLYKENEVDTALKQVITNKFRK
jgi:excisionase family DNA binding protein